ncbi:Clp protease N-terminal domain-containing protein [Herbidospora cretacea]|uniref:Clp protease N-terminal domain-containing protein n=1 Tax=Herbidospora cretacea TaxID=28444 RepID=UPI00077321C9|nr:Clp protease N-terminal domain-containing protein [Herbidospora cretacea]
MFERFTDRARQVIILANEEARALNHTWIGTEHIMLGLVREGQGLAAQAMAECRVELDQVRAAVVRMTGGPGEPPAGDAGHIPFTPRAKKILGLAHQEAMRRHDRHIGTEHIMLATLREGEGVAVQALVETGVAPEAVEDALEQRMQVQGAKDRSVLDRLTEPGDQVIRNTLRRHVEDRRLLTQVLESLDSLHRRLDAMGAPPDPGK